MDFTFLTNGINYILQKITDVVTFIGNLFKSVFVAIWAVIQDAFCLVIDVLSGAVSAAVSSLPVSTVESWSSYWAAVPSTVVQIAVACGIVPAFGIIAVALGIRLVLQLIPFVRLGS